MKSGSTFIAKVLSLYFGAERAEPVPYWGRLEQNLHEHLLPQYLDRGFVLQMHIKPHVPNVELIRRLGIALVWVWRNLGDVIVSFDDHIVQEDNRNPVCYIHDRERYMAMPRQHRYRYLIDHAIPWYIGFYLSWRKIRQELPFVETHYEDLASDPFRYFSNVIRALGHKVDEERLRAILASKPPATRLNRGINNRSIELLSPENKERLDSMLLQHFDDLAPIWHELPWRGPGGRAGASILSQLARCRYNRSAGTAAMTPAALRLNLKADDFHFRIPGALLAPPPGRTSRIKLIVRGEAGGAFGLYWRRWLFPFSRKRALPVRREPSSEPGAVEFVLGEEFARSRFDFRLNCFNALKQPAVCEILEAVKIDA